MGNLTLRSEHSYIHVVPFFISIQHV